MRRPRYLAVLPVVLALGAFVASAQADDTEALSPPTTSPIHYPMIESLEPVAESYWALRGVSLPLPVEVFAASNAEPWGGLAQMPGNRVWLTERTLGLRGPAGRDSLCMIYLHERGHNAGLEHGSGDPIMEAEPWATSKRALPKCFKWAESGFKASLDR